MVAFAVRYTVGMILALIASVALADPPATAGVPALIGLHLPDQALREVIVRPRLAVRNVRLQVGTDDMIDPRPTLRDPTGRYAVRFEPWCEEQVQGMWISGTF